MRIIWVLYLIMLGNNNNSNNSSTSFWLRSSSRRTELSIHFRPSLPTTIWMFVWVTLTLSSSTFYYETDNRKCEITLGGWHCGLKLSKLEPPLHTGFEPRSLAWLACSTGQSTSTYTTVACHVHHRGYVRVRMPWMPNELIRAYTSCYSYLFMYCIPNLYNLHWYYKSRMANWI